MKSYDKAAYIRYRVEKAIETYKVAELLVENEKWNSAINRLYYSAYYAISALLVKFEINTKTHAGVKTQFLLHFIKTGLIKLQLGKTYAECYSRIFGTLSVRKV